MLADRCVDVLSVAAAGLLLADRGDGLRVMVASSEQAKLLELFQIQHDEGPCLECYRGGEIVAAEQHDDGFARWPRLARAAGEMGYEGVIAVPMRVRGRVVGALNLFETLERPGLGAPTARVAQSMADVAAIAIDQVRLSRERVTLIEQLETALESRVAIEQAKGVLAHHLDVGLDEAFHLLRDRARRSRRLLKDVAQEVIDSRGADYS
ncbi:MAG: GAF and ANTAR domain-containing protein [Actinomycetota bacterium]|nr:GAF and ANTAR domain-containing protein [Actinomycetota bacterium]